MDKKLILAVAGAGKTTLLLNKLNENDRFLIITYTKSNYEDIKRKIVNKFSYIPNNIKIYTYFVFLYNFCFKPFEINLYPNKNIKTKGMEFKRITDNKFKETKIAYYMNTKSKKMYSSRLAKLCNKEKMFCKIKHRIEKYFDYLFIDEIQDLAGNDFNFINSLIRCNINLIYVGDFYQHTFDTSRDGKVNKNLHKSFEKYIGKFQKSNKDLNIDLHSLEKSIRCKKEVCKFIRDNLNIKIYSYSDSSNAIVREVLNDEEIKQIMYDNNIVKLFYQNSKEYNGKVENWGNSKGATYKDVCVILNKKTYSLFESNELKKLAMATKNRLYVACTRTENNLYFIEENKLKNYKKGV